MMAGRRPKPTALRVLQGNPGKRPFNPAEPALPALYLRCPRHLQGLARQEWARTAHVLADMGLLTRADRTALEVYCAAYQTWREAQEKIQAYGAVVAGAKGVATVSPYVTVADRAAAEMRAFWSEFGLTPASRTRIRVPEQRQADPLADFLTKGKEAHGG